MTEHSARFIQLIELVLELLDRSEVGLGCERVLQHADITIRLAPGLLGDRAPLDGGEFPGHEPRIVSGACGTPGSAAADRRVGIGL